MPARHARDCEREREIYSLSQRRSDCNTSLFDSSFCHFTRSGYLFIYFLFCPLSNLYVHKYIHMYTMLKMQLHWKIFSTSFETLYNVYDIFTRKYTFSNSVWCGKLLVSVLIYILIYTSLVCFIDSKVKFYVKTMSNNKKCSFVENLDCIGEMCGWEQLFNCYYLFLFFIQIFYFDDKYIYNWKMYEGK